MTRELAARKLAVARGLIAGPAPLGPGRVWTVLGMFLFAFCAIGVRMALLAVSVQSSAAEAAVVPSEHLPPPERAEILGPEWPDSSDQHLGLVASRKAIRNR